MNTHKVAVVFFLSPCVGSLLPLWHAVQVQSLRGVSCEFRGRLITLATRHTCWLRELRASEGKDRTSAGALLAGPAARTLVDVSWLSSTSEQQHNVLVLLNAEGSCGDLQSAAVSVWKACDVHILADGAANSIVSGACRHSARLPEDDSHALDSDRRIRAHLPFTAARGCGGLGLGHGAHSGRATGGWRSH